MIKFLLYLLNLNKSEIYTDSNGKVHEITFPIYLTRKEKKQIFLTQIINIEKKISTKPNNVVEFLSNICTIIMSIITGYSFIINFIKSIF